MANKAYSDPSATKAARENSEKLCRSEEAGSTTVGMLSAVPCFSEPLVAQPTGPDNSNSESGPPADSVPDEDLDSRVLSSVYTGPPACSQRQMSHTVSAYPTGNPLAMKTDRDIGAGNAHCPSAAVVAAATTALLLLQRRSEHEAKERPRLFRNQPSSPANTAWSTAQQRLYALLGSPVTCPLGMSAGHHRKSAAERSCTSSVLSRGVQTLAGLILRFRQQQMSPPISGDAVEAFATVSETTTILRKALETSAALPLCFQAGLEASLKTESNSLDDEGEIAHLDRRDEISSDVQRCSFADPEPPERSTGLVSRSDMQGMNCNCMADGHRTQVATAMLQQEPGALPTHCPGRFHQAFASRSGKGFRKNTASKRMVCETVTELRTHQRRPGGPFEAVIGTCLPNAERHSDGQDETVDVVRTISSNLFGRTAGTEQQSDKAPSDGATFPDPLDRSVPASFVRPSATVLSGLESSVLTGQLPIAGIIDRFESSLTAMSRPKHDGGKPDADARANTADDHLSPGLGFLRERLDCGSLFNGSHASETTVHKQHPKPGTTASCDRLVKGKSSAGGRSSREHEGLLGQQPTRRAKPSRTGTQETSLQTKDNAQPAVAPQPVSRVDLKVAPHSAEAAPLPRSLASEPAVGNRQPDASDRSGQASQGQMLIPGLERGVDSCELTGLLQQGNNQRRYPGTASPRATRDLQGAGSLEVQAPQQYPKSFYRRLSQGRFRSETVGRTDRAAMSQGYALANAIAALSAILTTSKLAYANAEDHGGVARRSFEQSRPSLLTTGGDRVIAECRRDVPYTIAQTMDMEFRAPASFAHELNKKPPEYAGNRWQLQHEATNSSRRPRLHSREQETSELLHISFLARNGESLVAPPPGLTKEPGQECVNKEKPSGSAVSTDVGATPTMSTRSASAAVCNLPVLAGDFPLLEALHSSEDQGPQAGDLCAVNIPGFRGLLENPGDSCNAGRMFSKTECRAASLGAVRTSAETEAEQTAARLPLGPPKPNMARVSKTCAHALGRDPLCPYLSQALLKNSGSTRHPKECRPCAFFWGRGCHNGLACRFCHEEHGPRKKKPMKDQKNLMIIARPDGRLEFIRCRLKEALNACG